MSRGRAFVGLLGFTVTTLWASPAFSSQSASNYPKVLREMVDAGNIQVVKQFPTDKDGLRGYIVKHNSYRTVVYSEDGYLMLGPLYGPEGHDLSKQYMRKYKPKAHVGKVIHSLDANRMVTEGPKDAPTLYIFADPNCIYCRRLYQRTQPLVTTGKLQVHWIMVGALGPSSMGRAATILEAKNPGATLAKNESNFDVVNEQGGVAIGKPNPSLGDVLDQNRQAMAALGSNGTPTVVYSDRDGDLKAHQGVPPKDWLEQYAQH